MADDRCQCITLHNTRCRLKVLQTYGRDHRYCHVHQNCTNNIYDNPKFKPKPIKSPVSAAFVSLRKPNPETEREDLAEKLRIGACAGSLEGVKSQISAGADVTYNKSEALICAIDKGHYVIVDELLRAGGNIKARKNYLVKHIVKRRDLPLLQYYVDNFKALINYEILTEAITLNDESIIDYIISKLNPTETLLFLLESTPNLKLVNKVISLGANVGVDNDKPLQIALKNKWYKTAKLLISHGANPHNTSLMKNAIKDNDPTAIYLLLENGAKSQPSALFNYAINTNNYDLLLYLLNLELNKGLDNTTIFKYAILHNHKDIVEKLLQGNIVPIEAVDQALKTAVSNNNVDLSKLLLENDADATMNNNELISIANGNANDELIDLLIDYGADKDILISEETPAAGCIVQ